VWSESVVPVEPAGERGGAFGAGAVDGAVGPALDERADEALRFPFVRGRYGRVRRCLMPSRLQASACTIAR
jgi:hypothetical protein